MLPHLVEGKVPELLLGHVEDGVLPAVRVAPEVAHPHVVASFSKDEALDGMSLRNY